MDMPTGKYRTEYYNIADYISLFKRIKQDK